jgi:hypothetical protein
VEHAPPLLANDGACFLSASPGSFSDPDTCFDGFFEGPGNASVSYSIDSSVYAIRGTPPANELGQAGAGAGSPTAIVHSQSALQEVPPPPLSCPGCEYYTSTLTGPGDGDLRVFFTNTATHQAILRGPSGANFDLYLFRFDHVEWRWTHVAGLGLNGPTSDEEIQYAGSAGYYLWVIYSAQGSGPYEAWIAQTPDGGPSETLVGAGDIASCGSLGDEATAALLDQIPGTVFTAGDNAYLDGSAQDFANCYDPSWGRHRERTFPALGNHDYRTNFGADYYAYFGDRAGDPGKGYYSYDLGSWHVIVLNSNSLSTLLNPLSPQFQALVIEQGQWLASDLAASTKLCTVAYWHHARFSSGLHGNEPLLDGLWRMLHGVGVDVVVVGHDHMYERFGPQTADALPDPGGGIRQFTVGTGGVGHYVFGASQPNSEVRNDTEFGVLKLTLYQESYDWEFVTAPLGVRMDAGSGTCH